MNIKKNILALFFAVLIFWGTGLQVNAEVAGKSIEEKKIICFIYDNSLSVGDEYQDILRYAVKMFCAMSDVQDEIWFYKVEDFNDLCNEDTPVYGMGEPFHIKSSMNSKNEWESDFEKLEEIEYIGKKTYTTGIEKAVYDIRNETGEKWIVMFTDGRVEKNKDEDEYGAEELNEKFKEILKGTDIKLYFSSLVKEMNIAGGDNIYTSDPECDDVLDHILSAIEVIYGKRKLETDEDIREGINFDVPVSEIMLLLYSEKEQINLTLEDENCIWSRAISANRDGEKPPYGYIAEFKMDEGVYANQDNYVLKVPVPDNVDEYSIYYTPFGEPSLRAQQDGSNIKEGRYVVGEYDLYAEWLNPKTGKAVEGDLGLLQGETCELERNEGIKLTANWGKNEMRKEQEGEETMILHTSLGDSQPLQIFFGKNYENCRLQIEGTDNIFFFNRMGERTDAICVEVMDGEENVTTDSMMPEIHFFQNGEESSEIKGEMEFDIQEKQWKIYPVLADSQNDMIAGDFLCDIDIAVETDYYEEPVVLSQTGIRLNMRAEEGLLKITIPQDILGDRDYICPFLGDKAALECEWRGQEADMKEIDDFKISWEIYGEEGEVIESGEEDTSTLRIPWEIDYLIREPAEIKITTRAEKFAYGKQYNVEKEEIIIMNGIPVYTKIGCIGIYMALALTVLWIIYLVVSFMVAIKRGERAWRCPEIYRSAGEIWDIGKTKWKSKYRGERGLLLKGYYVMRVSLPPNSGLNNLEMKMYYKRGDYLMTVYGMSENEIKMYIDGKQIDLRNQRVEGGKVIQICEITGNEICKIKIVER